MNMNKTHSRNIIGATIDVSFVLETGMGGYRPTDVMAVGSDTHREERWGRMGRGGSEREIVIVLLHPGHSRPRPSLGRPAPP